MHNTLLAELSSVKKIEFMMEYALKIFYYFNNLLDEKIIWKLNFFWNKFFKTVFQKKIFTKCTSCISMYLYIQGDPKRCVPMKISIVTD